MRAGVRWPRSVAPRMRRRTEAAAVELVVKGVALLLALAVAYFAVVWPWKLGSHRSVEFAWALWIAYLVLAGDIIQFTWRAHRARRAEAVRAKSVRVQAQHELVAYEQAARAEAARRSGWRVTWRCAPRRPSMRRLHGTGPLRPRNAAESSTRLPDGCGCRPMRRACNAGRTAQNGPTRPNGSSPVFDRTAGTSPTPPAG